MSDPDLELVARLRLAVMRLARRLRQQAEPGLTPSMLSALSSLERRGPLTLGDLAAIERIQPPTVTKIVARLESDGLVGRTQDPDDKRVIKAGLTAKGRRSVERARSRKDAYLAQRLANLERTEVASLAAALDVLERILDEDSS